VVFDERETKGFCCINGNHHTTGVNLGIFPISDHDMQIIVTAMGIGFLADNGM